MESYSELVTKVFDNFAHLNFDRKNKLHLYMVCLYCTIVELSDSLICLAKSGKGVGIPILNRTLLEAYVDLKNLEQNPEYCYNMDASYIQEWLRATKEAGTLENPYLKGMADLEDFDDQIAEWQNELEQLCQDGHQVLKQLEKFRNVGMEKEYRSIYNFLCSESHNNIRSLQGRHIQISEDSDDFKVVAFTKFENADDDKHLMVCQEFLKRASKAIHSTLETGKEGVFNGP